eukprot:TRINITY_DN26125_c0_g1_i1.p1 TRINITY_DN26125_c0_g1~~TRINITY_DN26125_c0_g1_i1.p1  ORF type:complete len:222 (+),score=60.51 TRINITY_DN26125_c0_g1_i1:118-783(+)
MIRRPPRSTQGVSSAASDVYKRQVSTQSTWGEEEAPPPRPGTITPEEISKCFEEITLRGSYIDTVQSENLEYERNLMTFDHTNKMFYLLSFENTSVICALEYSDYPNLMKSTFTQTLKEYLEKPPSPLKSTKELSLYILNFLKKFEEVRHNMPWKWHLWETFYCKVSNDLPNKLGKSPAAKKELSLIHISEPTRPLYISYAVFCLKKKKKTSHYKHIYSKR